MKKAYYGLLTFAIMSLSYDLYYWKMRSAVGVLRGEDKFLCLSSGSICVLIIWTIKRNLLRIVLFGWFVLLWVVMMINPDILSTKAFGLVLSISVVGEMILSLVKKEQFQKEEFSPKIKITAGIMIVLLLVHLIF